MFAHNYHREAGTKRSAKYRLPRRPGGLLGMSNHSSLASEAKQSLPVSLSMRMRVRVRLNATSETLRSYPVRGLETGTIRKSGPVHGLPTRAFSAGVLRKRPARSESQTPCTVCPHALSALACFARDRHDLKVRPRARSARTRFQRWGASQETGTNPSVISEGAQRPRRSAHHPSKRVLFLALPKRVTS